ncbi:MAG: outer membrane lipoprotein carrier protein LolA [Alphaproteobacteria bacterium]|nr:outer membrane lipoprotein carrier protein LolA [Alphaproteobacteria bacterium]
MRIHALFLALCLMALPAWGASPSNLSPKRTAKTGDAKPAAIPEPAKPATRVTPAKLSESDKADIARIEKYLNELKSVAAGFTQVNDMGEFRHGKIAIQRPGKMRVTYDPPQKDFIVADGTFVHIWDAGMEQQTNVPVGSSIAEFILRDPIKLSGDVTVTKFVRFPAKLELSIVSAKDPGDGELTLIFEDKPLQLRQWRVLDALGRTTGVNLENAREGVTFASNTFDFVPPNFGKRP